MQELTTENFATATAKGNAIVDFWAPWCAPCRMMAPAFEESSKNHKNITFAKLDTDQNSDIAQELGIRGIPTIIFFKDGKEINRYVGALTRPQIEAKIKENFG